jgi:hypothetical protein
MLRYNSRLIFNFFLIKKKVNLTQEVSSSNSIVNGAVSYKQVQTYVVANNDEDIVKDKLTSWQEKISDGSSMFNVNGSSSSMMIYCGCSFI